MSSKVKTKEKKGKSTEKSTEKKAVSKKAVAASSTAFLATAANVTSAVKKISSAYNNVKEANLNALIAGFDYDYDASSVPAGSASAAVPALKKSVKRLEDTSEAVVSSSAAAIRSPSPKAFAAVAAKLDAASKVIGEVKAKAAAAEDAAFVAAVKAQLAKDSTLGDSMITYLNALPPMLQCTQIKLFLGQLWKSKKIDESARKSLHSYLLGPKALTCRTTTTEKDVVKYLIDIIGVAQKVGEPARGILFRTDIFNTRTISGLPGSTSGALNNFFLEEWVQFKKTTGGSRKRRRLNRRFNRTKKI